MISCPPLCGKRCSSPLWRTAPRPPPNSFFLPSVRPPGVLQRLPLSFRRSSRSVPKNAPDWSLLLFFQPESPPPKLTTPFFLAWAFKVWNYLADVPLPLPPTNQDRPGPLPPLFRRAPRGEGLSHPPLSGNRGVKY